MIFSPSCGSKLKYKNDIYNIFVTKQLQQQQKSYISIYFLFWRKKPLRVRDRHEREQIMKILILVKLVPFENGFISAYIYNNCDQLFIQIHIDNPAKQIIHKCLHFQLFIDQN